MTTIRSLNLPAVENIGSVLGSVVQWGKSSPKAPLFHDMLEETLDAGTILGDKVSRWPSGFYVFPGDLEIFEAYRRITGQEHLTRQGDGLGPHEKLAVYCALQGARAEAYLVNHTPVLQITLPCRLQAVQDAFSRGVASPKLWAGLYEVMVEEKKMEGCPDLVYSSEPRPPRSPREFDLETWMPPNDYLH